MPIRRKAKENHTYKSTNPILSLCFLPKKSNKKKDIHYHHCCHYKEGHERLRFVLKRIWTGAEGAEHEGGLGKISSISDGVDQGAAADERRLRHRTEIIQGVEGGVQPFQGRPEKGQDPEGEKVQFDETPKAIEEKAQHAGLSLEPIRILFMPHPPSSTEKSPYAALTRSVSETKTKCQVKNKRQKKTRCQEKK